MATRRSLVSRGFTSVAAGPSSTNRFLSAPRTVGEFTSTAQSVEDLRTTKNATGPAANPLRPRARVDSGGSDVTPDTSFDAGGRARASVRGAEFDLETKGKANVDAFGAIPATGSQITNQNRGIQAGLTVLGMVAPPLAPFTQVASIVSAVNASNKIDSLSNPLEGTPANTLGNRISREVDSTIQSIQDFSIQDEVDSFAKVPGQVINVALGALQTATDITGIGQTTSQKTSAKNAGSAQRASRQERAAQSTANQNTLDLRVAKEAAQQAAIASIAASARNSRGQTQSQSEGGFTGRGDQAAQDVSSQVDSFSGFNR